MFRPPCGFADSQASSFARGSRGKIRLQEGLGAVEMDGDLVDQITADQRRCAKAHGPDDRTVAVQRNLHSVEWKRAWEALNPGDR